MKNARKEPGKYIGTFTARGSASEGETETDGPVRIRLFDGSFQTAFVVREFYVWAQNYNSSTNPDVIAKLATSPNASTGAPTFMDADDGREIAWGGMTASTDSAPFNQNSIIDPENLVIEDLWFYVRGTNETTSVANYLIVLDKYDITETLGAVSMAKDRSRDSQSEWRTR